MVLSLMMSVPPAQARDITFNFKDADIHAFIKYIADLTGKDFLVDSRVKGKINIISPKPIPEKDVYNVFLSVLEVNGYVAIPSGSVIKIIPRIEGKQQALPVVGTQAPNTEAMITQVLRLQYADAKQLVPMLRPLLSRNSQIEAYPRGNMLVVTDSADNILRIQRIIAMLDRKESIGMHVFRLKHVSSDRIASIITNLYQGQPQQAGGTQLKAIPYQPGNMLVVVGMPQSVNEVAGIVRKLDVAPRTNTGRLQVRYLKFADAKNVAKILNSISSRNKSSSMAPTSKALFAGSVKVVADPPLNAILITADPNDIAAVDSIVDKLDIRRKQVLVEALIVEVTTNMAQQFGIEWRAMNNPNSSKVSPFGGTAFSNSAGTNINSVAANPFSAGNGMMVGIVKGTVTFAGQTFLNLGALARALEEKVDTNVLSTPDLLTMDNEEAKIVVGQNVPFLTGSYAQSASIAGGTTSVNPFQTIQRKDIGLTLKIKPHISAGNTVRLDLYQEISSIDTNPGVASADIITNKRSIKTVVLANNSQIIVLGGLMQDTNSTDVQQVPCIGAAPIIGEAFKYTTHSRKKTDLLVFLKPVIISSNNDISGITSQKYYDIKKLYEQPVKGGTIIFPEVKKHMPTDLRPEQQKPSAPTTAKPPVQGH